MLCPHRHLAQRGIAQPPSSKDASSGGRIHAALAGWIEPRTLAQSERDTFDMIREIEKKLIIGFFGENARMKVIREQQDGRTRLWARIPDGNGGFYDHSAQPDVIFRAELKALIIEYKTLAGDIPEAPENLQLRDQAVLYRGNNALLEEIGCAVAQPLVTMQPIVCLYDKDALDRAEKEMFERVRKSNDPASLAVAGEHQCQFCLAKTRCVQYQQWAGSTVPGMLNVLDVPVANWTPEQCAMFLDKRKVAQKWLDTVLDEIEARLAKSPDAVPGYYLKPGAVREIITNPQTVWDRFSALGGKLEDFMGCIAVGKAKLKEKLANTTGAKGKRLDEALSTLVDGAIEKQQNKSSICKRDE